MTSDLPDSWTHSTIESFAPLSYGKGLPEKERDSNGAVPVFGSNGKVGQHSDAFVSGSGVVIGRKGSIGRVHRAAGPFWPIDTTFFVPEGSERDTRFTYYLFKALEPRLAGMNTDSAVPGLNRHRAHAETIAVPPIVEQRHIGRVLGTLDDKIASNRRIAATLEQIAATLFKALFVYFVDHDDLVESEIGPIPRRWDIAPVGEALRVVGGSTPSTKEPVYWDGGAHCWATPKDLSGLDEPILLDTARHITDAGVERISSGLLPPRTVLMSSRAPIGYTVISLVPIAVNQGFIAVPPSDDVPSEYVLFWMRENMDRIKANAGGTTFAEISKRAFRPLPMLLPPEQALNDFAQTAAPLIDRIAACVRENLWLAALRDALLPKLISGELRVDQPEAAEVTV
jgi:type I restriction enzyme S subunit